VKTPSAAHIFRHVLNLDDNITFFCLGDMLTTSVGRGTYVHTLSILKVLVCIDASARALLLSVRAMRRRFWSLW
jgi:hypothetical protein